MMRRTSAVFLLALAAACSSGSAKTAAPSPTASPTPAPTAKPVTTGSLLRSVAVAEETYYTDYVKYLAFTGKVPEALDQVPPVPTGTKVGVALIGSDGFCAVAYLTGTKQFAIYDSTHGGLVKASAKPSEISPACRTLAAKLVSSP